MAMKVQGGRMVPVKDQSRERASNALTGLVQKIDEAMKGAAASTTLKPVVKSNVADSLRRARSGIIEAIQSLEFNEDF